MGFNDVNPYKNPYELIMELRNRATGQQSQPSEKQSHDVTLGPTIYAGERYGKMSERIKRQKKHGVDVDQTTKRLLTPRIAGVMIGLVGVFLVLAWLKYQVNQRRLSRDQILQ